MKEYQNKAAYGGRQNNLIHLRLCYTTKERVRHRKKQERVSPSLEFWPREGSRTAGDKTIKYIFACDLQRRNAPGIGKSKSV